MSAESSYIICGSSFLFKLNKVIMKEKKFKIGDRVRIHPSSRFAHQCLEPGVVRKTDDDCWIGVDFDDGYKNAYPPEDLYLDASFVSPSVDQEFHVGDMIEITQGSEHWVSEMDKYVGKIATITKVEPGSVVNQIYRIDIDNGEWKWIPQAGHFINAPQHGLDQKDELLYRAKEMFPVGTKFCPAHQIYDIHIRHQVHCIITHDTSIEFDSDGNIYAMVGDRRWFSSEIPKYGNTAYDRVLYVAREKKWAHIYPTVEKEEPQEDDKPVPVDDIMVIEAKKRYPIGTRFYPAHQEYNVGDSEYCIITDDTKIEAGSDGTIYASINGSWWDSTHDPKYGNTRWNRVLWDSDDDKWAPVIATAPEFSVGDKVMITESKDNWCPEMDEFIGKIATLTKARGSKGTHFSIDLDNGEWAWSDKDGHFRKPTEDELSDDPTPIKFKYKPGDTVTLTETCHGVGPQEVTIRDYSESYGKPAYTLHTWVGRFPEDILSPIEESKPTLKFKVGDFVVGNRKANTRYSVTREGWTGEVTKVEERNGSTFMSVQGKYNKDNSHFDSLDANYFDLTTEDEHDPRVVLTATTTPASYSLQEEFDKLTVSMSDITQVYTDSKGRIRHTWSTSTPVVEELPTLRVKKVSFNRI